MTEAILTMGGSTRLVDSLISGLQNKDLFFSLGEVIPNLNSYDKVSYWMGGAYALQLQNIGLAKTLCSPGSSWLPELDINLSGRKIFGGTIHDLPDYGERKLWVKAAEAKINDMPAKTYTYAEVRNIFDKNNFSSGIELQWTESILNIDFEHRFFIAEGQVITGSPYKVHGVGYSKDIDFSKQSEAETFAQFVVDSCGDNFPTYCTLDVALNMVTNEWLVVEANRAWSSGLYGSNSQLALGVIDAACSYDGERWQWKPDKHLIDLSKSWEPLKVIPSDDQTLGFFKYVKP